MFIIEGSETRFDIVTKLKPECKLNLKKIGARNTPKILFTRFEGKVKINKSIKKEKISKS